MILHLAQSADWGTRFQAFSQYHLVVASLCLLAIMVACVFGLLLRGTTLESRVRVACGWAILAYKIAETIHDCWPGRFNIQTSLPLQICDLAILVAAGAMITQRRTFRTLLYFWGLGLSTQAACMPALQDGYHSRVFWFFWISHTLVIGAAIYDLIVQRYRPRFGDFLVAFVYSLGYVLILTAVDLTFGFNYGYLGNIEAAHPTVIDKLGPYPIRVFKLCSMVFVIYVLLWAIWPMGRVLVRRIHSKRPPADRPAVS